VVVEAEDEVVVEELQQTTVLTEISQAAYTMANALVQQQDL
jgi:hypothetical protein